MVGSLGSFGLEGGVVTLQHTSWGGGGGGWFGGAQGAPFGPSPGGGG